MGSLAGCGCQVRTRGHRGDAGPRDRGRGHPQQPLRPTAHVLLGALDEAALFVSRATDSREVRSEMDTVCERLISGIAGFYSIRHDRH